MDVTWWAMPNIVEKGCPRGGFIDIERFAVRVDRCVVDNDTELRLTNNTDLQALSVTLAYYRPDVRTPTEAGGRPPGRLLAIPTLDGCKTKRASGPFGPSVLFVP
jgi:hypothetical protein